MKKSFLGKTTALTGVVACLAAHSGWGQIPFADNFDAGTSASAWTAVLSHADAFADFAFNYGTLGIPSAPNSTGGSTVGLRFLANQSAGVQQGISASPNGQSFIGDFRLEFDMWLNYTGPLNGGGAGSTEVGSFGWGTSGAAAQWAGSSSSIMFGATGDGGSSFDYRVYRNNGLLAPASGVYAAGITTSPEVRDAGNAFYTSKFGGETAPTGQVTLFPGQTGATLAGTLGFKWRDVIVEKVGSVLTWKVDGYTLATADSAGATLSGNNIFLGLFDINASSSPDANDFLVNAIYDNVRVTAVPEPSTVALAICGGLGSLLARRRRP